MGILDLLEAENLRRLRLVGALGDAVDNRLERNLRERKRRRSGDERTRKDAKMDAARHLEHGLESKRSAAAEKSNKTYVRPAAHRRERIQHCRIADDVENRVDPLWVTLADAPGELKRLKQNFLRAERFQHRGARGVASRRDNARAGMGGNVHGGLTKRGGGAANSNGLIAGERHDANETGPCRRIGLRDCGEFLPRQLGILCERLDQSGSEQHTPALHSPHHLIYPLLLVKTNSN